MINIIELLKHQAFTPRLAKLFDHVFDTLQGTGKAAAALFDNPCLVASKFIDNRSRENEGDFALSHQLLKGTENGLLVVILREVEPNTSIDENLVPGLAYRNAQPPRLRLSRRGLRSCNHPTPAEPGLLANLRTFPRNR